MEIVVLGRYEYIKSFEQPDRILPNTWIVVRIDGRGFHKYAFGPYTSLHFINSPLSPILLVLYFTSFLTTK